MEIRKFVRVDFEEEEEEIFIKDGENTYEIFLADNGDLRYFGSVKKNGIKITTKREDALKLYHAFGCSEIKPERTFNYSDCEEFDQYDWLEEQFENYVEMAREWLYA